MFYLRLAFFAGFAGAAFGLLVQAAGVIAPILLPAGHSAN